MTAKILDREGPAIKCPMCKGTGKVIDGNNFGARMRVRRKARGWGIREAAGAACISPSTWSRGERGHLTSITILKKIADVLDGHLSEMLREDEEDEAQWEDYAQDRLKARFSMEGIRGAPEGMMP